MRRRISATTTIGGLALVVLISAQAAAAVSWTAATSASALHGFNPGRALATTKSGSTTYVHQVYVNDYPGGTAAGDGSGQPREAIMYQRRSASGAAMGAAKRVNKSTQHGNGSAIAAAGSHVYVVWSHLAKYFYAPSDARTLQFRSNATNGAGTWASMKNLTTSGQIDSPSIAASGSYVYIGYTNTATGAVKLLISDDFGANFHDSGLSMAAVTYDNGYGKWANTAVAAAGANVGMAWLSGDTFTASAWTSTNHAGAKNDFTLAAGSAVGNPRVAAVGTRIAFSLPTCGGGCVTGSILVKIWDGGTLGPDRSAASFATGDTFKRTFNADVALTGTAGVGVAYSGCRLSTCASTESPAAGVDMIWSESTDSGATWKSPFTLQSSTGTTTSGKQRRLDQYASILFLTSTKRIVVFDAYSGTSSKGNVLLRAGTGTP